MKYKFIFGLFLACATAALAQPIYRNDGVVQAPPDIPPQIDAQTFVNAGQFIINMTNDNSFNDFLPPALLPVYQTQNTLNYTNEAGALLAANTGFRLDLFDSSTGRTRSASVFHNDGDIHCGTLDTLNYLTLQGTTWILKNEFIFFTIAGARFTVAATNIVNHGTIDMGFDSMLKFDGDSVDLTHSVLEADTTGFGIGQTNTIFFSFFNNSIFDGYWGIGDPVTQRPVFYPTGIDPNFYFNSSFPQTPIHDVTTRQGATLPQSLGGPEFVSYFNETFDASGSNRFVRIAFVANTNADLQANVYMPTFGPIILEYTNITSASNINLYVEDDFGTLTNFSLQVNKLAGYHQATQIPFDYSLFESTALFFFGGATPETPATIPPGTFAPGNVTNQWQAYEALFRPVSFIEEDVFGRNPTNGPGRMEIRASGALNLSDSQISSQNYLLLQSPNHYLGNTNAQIYSPIEDLNLRSTNGVLIISNLLAANVKRFEGSLDLFSARWTNVDVSAAGSVTNHYHVLFADSQFSPLAPVRSQDVTLRTVDLGGNTDQLLISDVISVTRNLLLDSSRITFTTNDASANSRFGGLNILDTGIVWPRVAPRLQFLTNNGSISSVNTMFFGGLRTSPYYSTTFSEPYQVFINSGSISNFASEIQANLFINSGEVLAWGGGIKLTSQTAILTNGSFIAPSNRVELTSGALQISNHMIVSGGALSLSASTILDDGSLNPTGFDSADYVTNKNVWTAGNGFNLLQIPFGSASLLATTISNTAPAFRQVFNRSAAHDLGCSTAGFNKNAAIGRMVLDGGNKSLFTFSPVTGNNAFYIDELDLENYATNSTGSNFFGIQINAGMKIYFANATANGVSIAEKLDGANNGRFCWVKDYNCGFFSSTNMVYPDGSTNRVNTALAQDCNVDSDGDGAVNCLDPSPIPATGSSCTPAPFPPVVVPVPAITSGSTTGGSSGGNSQGGGFDSAGNPKIGTPPTTDNTNGPATFLKGVYVGLFSDVSNGVATANSGYFTVSTTTHGKFTAKIILGGHTYSASGLFGQDGQATVKFRRGSLRAITAALQLDNAGGQITGSLTDSNWTSTLIADRLVFTKKGKSAGDFAGNYTFRIPAQADSPDSPAGDGFGTVTIDVAGGVKLNGSLADGSKIAQKSALSEQGFWPLYSSLYKGSGCLLGWLQVSNTGNLGGQVVWTKAANHESKNYPGGFTNDVPASGSVYRKPVKHGKVLDWSHGQLILNGGGLAAWTNTITLDLNNKATDSENKLQLNLIAPSGLFKGHIMNPDTGKLLQIQGSVFQDSNMGFGYFLNSGLSGQVILTP